MPLSGRLTVRKCGFERETLLRVRFAHRSATRYTAPSMAIAHENSPDRLVSASRAEDEHGFELKLRPPRLPEFIGQTNAKEPVAIAPEAANSPLEALDHMLLFAPAGLRRTP